MPQEGEKYFSKFSK